MIAFIAIAASCLCAMRASKEADHSPTGRFWLVASAELLAIGTLLAYLDTKGV